MDETAMIFEQIPLGPMNNFSYLIGDAATRQVGVVDPGWDARTLLGICEEKNYKIAAVLLTHGHYDHANALKELLKNTPVPVYLSKHEPAYYQPECDNIHFVEHNEKILIGSLEVQCLHTPGHTPGSQCFLAGNNLLTGDTLFIDGCGRCDLPGGDSEKMFHTLYNLILKLPESTVIYPGHDYGKTPQALLKDQKGSNPYLTCRSREEFIEHRMGITL